MYKLYTDGPGFLLMNPDDPERAFPVPDLHHLMHLRIRIGDYLDNGTADGPATIHPAGRDLTYISSAEAIRLAAQQDLRLPNSTIVYAAKNKNIAEAKKIGGRYKFPKWAFLEWLETWKEERARLKVETRKGA